MALGVPLLATFNAIAEAYAVLPYLALGAMVAFIVMPLEWLVTGCFVLAAIVAGSIEYFAKVTQAFWLPYLMGMLFALRGVVERMRLTPASARPDGMRPRAPHGLHPIVAWAMLFFVVSIFTTVIALPPLTQVVVAAKNYYFLWGIFLVLLWSPWQVEATHRFWNTVIWVACLQWPVVLYQRFVVASKRKDAAAWDAIVGTFGGDPEGGGHSAAMALVACIAITAIVFRMREKRLRAIYGMPMILLSLLPIALAEVKAAFIWLALAFVLFFARQVVREPVKALTTLFIGMALLGGLGFIYKTTFYEGNGGSGSSLSDIYDKQIKYSIDPNEYSSGYRRLGRVTALVYWWQRNDISGDPMHALIGNGLGSVRSSSSLGMGELAQKMTIQVDISAASTLLWDAGLLGALSFAAMMLAGVSAGIRQSRSRSLSPEWRESSFLAAATLAMCAIGLIYNRDSIDTPSIEIIVMFCLAQVMLARRQLAVQHAPGA